MCKQFVTLEFAAIFIFGIICNANADQNNSLDKVDKNGNARCYIEDNYSDINAEQALITSYSVHQDRTLNEYRQNISRLESRSGAYGYEIVPELIGMGLLQRNADDNLEAEKTFRRALYIIRINEGLYSVNQIPLLDLMIESQAAVKDWKKVADMYDHMFWLYRRNFTAADPRLLPVLKRLRHWYLNAYNKKTGRSLKQLFAAAETVHDQAIAIIRNCGANRIQALCFWHKTCCDDGSTNQGFCPEKVLVITE